MMKLYEQFRAVPKEAQKEIGGGKLKGFTDINPMWRIKALTEAFGVVGQGWYYTIDEKNVIETHSGEKSVQVEISLFVKQDDKWSEAIKGIGGSMIVATERGQLVSNDEAFKMALTDAISVSCKALGMGADIYWSNDRTKYTSEPPFEVPDNPITAEDLKEMQRLDIDIDKLADYLKKSVDKLSHDDAVKAIRTKKAHMEGKK
ncbi:MAG TPA: hypothetical protein PLT50_00485 [bacterium]|nr:hypothetical protein [bacterium]